MIGKSNTNYRMMYLDSVKMLELRIGLPLKLYKIRLTKQVLSNIVGKPTNPPHDCMFSQDVMKIGQSSYKRPMLI